MFKIILSFYFLCPHNAWHNAAVIRSKDALCKRMVGLMEYFINSGFFKHIERKRESDTGDK